MGEDKMSSDTQDAVTKARTAQSWASNNLDSFRLPNKHKVAPKPSRRRNRRSARCELSTDRPVRKPSSRSRSSELGAGREKLQVDGLVRMEAVPWPTFAQLLPKLALPSGELHSRVDILQRGKQSTMARMKRPARDFDDYLAAVPEPARTTLEKVRRVIRAAVPEATETISYGLPTFSTRGSPSSPRERRRTTARST
jgi:hypothetical protein